jgi:MFS family permease
MNDSRVLQGGAGAAPTRARYGVLWFAITLAVITYIDRVCISQAAPQIQKEMGLTKEQMSLVFSAFTLAYALFEIPGGWLGDKFGPRSVLMKVVSMWSFFTAATGWAWNMASLVVCRFLFGAGEAGCFPNLTKAFTLWLPHGERVRAQGFMWLSARWGGAFTPLLVAGTMALVSWRMTFVIYGAIGVVWAVLFYRWFRDNPREHPSVNAAELALLEGAEHNVGAHVHVPWRKLLASRTVWMLWVQYFCMAYGWYFYITWLPTYLKEQGVTGGHAAFLAGFPLFFGGLGSLFAGLIAPHAARWLGSRARARQVMAFVGMSGAAVMLVVATVTRMPLLTALAMGLSSFGNDLAMPGAWGACMDVGGKYSGSLSGSMNMMGNAGGALAPMVVPMVLKATNDNWNANFIMFAVVYALGAFCWLFIDPVTPLDKDESEVRSH